MSDFVIVRSSKPFTMVNNLLFDKWMPTLTGNQFKVACALIRLSDQNKSVSVEAISTITGIDEETVLFILDGLFSTTFFFEDMGLVR